MKKLLNGPQMLGTVLLGFWGVIFFSIVSLPVEMSVYLDDRPVEWVWQIVVALIMLVATAGIMWVLFRHYRRLTPDEPFYPTRQQLAFGVVFGIGMIFLGTFFTLFLPDSTENQRALELLLANPSARLWLFISVVVMAPLMEEIIFRGFLMRGVFSAQAFWLPIIVSGMIFGMMHLFNNWLELVPYAFMGMMMAWVFQITRNIFVPIVVHALNNFVSALYMFEWLPEFSFLGHVLLEGAILVAAIGIYMTVYKQPRQIVSARSTQI